MSLDVALAIGAAVVAATVGFATRRREVLLGPDEAYLWYGTQRLLAGEQPVRDLRSYEPGRYWWCRAFAVVLDDGLVTMRLASHVAAGAALLLLGVSLATAGANPAGLVAIPVAAMGWRANHFKLVDTAVLALVAAAGVAMLDGVPGGSAALGVTIGVAALTGTNLGAYALVAGGLLVLLQLPGGGGGGTALTVAAGLVVGLLPMAAWLGRHRGTAAALWHARVVVPRRRGTTNLPLPVPWPWRPDRPVRGTESATSRAIVRLGFVLVPLVCVGVLAAALVGRPDVTAAAPLAAVALPAFHHATSRADLAHLGLTAPFALGSLAVVPGPVGMLAAILTVGVTARLFLETHPRLKRRRTPAAFTRRQLQHDLVWLPRSTALQLDAVIAARHPDESLAALPYGLPLVAALGLRSAVYDTYCVYPVDPGDDARMRGELDAARPVLVLVDTRPLQEPSGVGFPMTHPTTWAWLQEAGTVVDDDRLPPTVSLWRVGDR